MAAMFGDFWRLTGAAAQDTTNEKPNTIGNGAHTHTQVCVFFAYCILLEFIGYMIYWFADGFEI